MAASGEGILVATFDDSVHVLAQRLVDRDVHLAKQAVWLDVIPKEWLGGSGARVSRGEWSGRAATSGSLLSAPRRSRRDGRWAVTRLTITLPDGRHVSPHWTAVSHEDGQWRFVQTYASVAIPNEEIGWVLAGEPPEGARFIKQLGPTCMRPGSDGHR